MSHFAKVSITCNTAFSPPVSHYNTVKSPLVTKYLGDKVIIGWSVIAVYRAIGWHYCGCTCLFYSNLKAFKVNLSYCTLTCNMLSSMSSHFLSIKSEVLDCTCNANSVHSLKLSCSVSTCYKWIFTKVLEVTAVKWMSVKVHSRS